MAGGRVNGKRVADRRSLRKEGGGKRGSEARRRRFTRGVTAYEGRTVSRSGGEGAFVSREEGAGRGRMETIPYAGRRISERGGSRRAPAGKGVEVTSYVAGMGIGGRGSGALEMVRGRGTGKINGPRESKLHGGRREEWGRLWRRRRTTALIGLLPVLVLACVVLYRPVVRYLESSKELANAEARLAEERALTRELEERRDFASSDSYVEGEARRMGYVKPGEIPLVVLDDKDEAVGSEAGVEGEEEDTTPP